MNQMNQIKLKAGLPDLPEGLMIARDRGEVLFIAMSDPIDQVRNGTKWDEVKNTLNDYQRTELKFLAQGEFVLLDLARPADIPGAQDWALMPNQQIAYRQSFGSSPD